MQFDHDLERIIPTSVVAGAETITFGGNAGISIPAGSTAQRPTVPIAGTTRFNSSSVQLETFTGSAWQGVISSVVAGGGISVSQTGGAVIISSSGGSVSSVGLAAAPSVFSVGGSPVTSSGTLSLELISQPSNTVFAGPTAVGGAAAPTFRTIGLASNDINDVTITTPTVNQVLAYNGTRWVNTGAVGANATGLVGVGQAGAAAWTLISGTNYRADFAHNLGTSNVVITVYDSTTNVVVIPSTITLTNNNTVRIQVVGNTRTLRVVVVANGQSIVSGGSTPSSVIAAKDGFTVSTATRLNFVGQAVGVIDAGGGTTNVTIGSRFSYFANSLDNPNNTDFAVNALAPVVTDPSFASLNVRSFSNTVEQGVAFTCSIPAGATTMIIKFRGRTQAAQPSVTVVQPRLYHRLLPNNTAVGAWSAAQELSNISIPANAFFQYTAQTFSLATLGLTADRLYQFELTRRVAGVTGGTNLPSNFLLAEITVEFA